MSLQKQLIESANEVTRLQKVRSRLDQLNQEIADTQGKLEFLVKKVDEESEDIDALNKTGIKSIFYKILGSKEEQLEKERQELLQVNLEYDEVRKSLELLEYERNILEGKVGELPAAEKHHQRLLKRREEEILDSNPVLAKQIYSIDHEIDLRRKMIFEMQEALNVGADALKLLDNVMNKLQQAQNWGQWNNRRRGMINMSARYMDHAKDAAYRARISLQQFERELKDVYGAQNFNLNFRFESSSSFVDVFFDNLITDWVVHQKIQNTFASVRSVRDRTYRLASTLQNEVPKVEQEMNQLAIQRKQLIQGVA